jgi:hypothetical protein
VAKNLLLILRKQRDSLDRAIRALEELQELRLTVHADGPDHPAVGQAGAKVLRFCKKLDREQLDQPPPLPTGTDPGED